MPIYSPGFHVCRFYKDKEELLDILVPYFREGLTNGEFCLWVLSDSVNETEARAALLGAVPDVEARIKKGQLEFVPRDEWYTDKSGAMNRLDEVLARWVDTEKRALAEGYPALRATGDTQWITASQWEDFMDYERKVDAAIGGYQLIALCTYLLERCGPKEIRQIVESHQCAYAKNSKNAETGDAAGHAEKARLALEALGLQFPKMRDAEERFAALFNQAAVGIAESDLDGRVVLANDRFCEITGRSREELLRLNFADLAHPDELRATMDVFERSKGGQPGILEKRYQKPSGEVVWVRNSISVVRSADGKPVNVLCVSQDITEKKLFEEAIARQTERLAESNRELEQFAYVASHDLQEPLRKIVNFSDRIKERRQTVDPVEKDYFDRMQQAALRMKHLIEGLLDFGRVGAAQRNSLTEVNLGSMVREILNDLDLRVQETGAMITLGPMPTIKANPLQMRQLFQNLIGNALKYTRPGVPPEVRVESRSEEGWIRIDVSDNGIGFDEKYLDRIFKPFQRLHGRDEYEGTGMGLAICQKIVAWHEGSLGAASSPGKGAKFTVTLPETAGTVLQRKRPTVDEMLVHDSHGQHLVEFYDDDEFLVDSVRHFLVDGLRKNEALVVIATPDHRAGILQALAKSGYDIEALRCSGQAAFLDADETLARFMTGTIPNAERFEGAVGGVFAKMHARGYERVRAYGEMVEILRLRRQASAMLRIEEFWSALAARYRFTLLCAYKLNPLNPALQNDLKDICLRHTAVIPAKNPEAYERAVEKAMRDVLGPSHATLLGGVLSCRTKNHAASSISRAQSGLFWIQQNMPYFMEPVLSRAMQYMRHPGAEITAA